MIEKIIDIAFSGFWAFVGMTILLNGLAYFAVNALIKLWIRLTRTFMVITRGWPPAHLDADGDWKPIEKTEEERRTILKNLKNEKI